MASDLRELESRLRSTFGAWHHYQLRLWQECRSINAAGVEDRIRVAIEVLADDDRGGWVWALGGWHMLLGEIQSKLSDLDPHIRQDAAVALADLGTHARSAIPFLLERLGSPESTIHDRTYAARALPRIGVNEQQALPILLTVLDESSDQREADELRFRVAEAVEVLCDSFRILVPLARRCLQDRGWKSRTHGLALVERLGKRSRRLLEMLMPNVMPLLDDDVDENRFLARRIVERVYGGRVSKLRTEQLS